MARIRYENVSKYYGEGDNRVHAVDNVSITAEEDKVTTLVGPSGCGKTTLLHVAAGLLSPSNGNVILDGEEITGPSPNRAVVFQQFALFPWKTVRENIEFGLSLTDDKAKAKQQVVEKWINTMGLEGFENSYPHELSGGMKQRVAIARSYALSPKVLLMDEPFGALDAQTRTVMQEELLTLLKEEEHTVIFITHNVDEAIYLGDRIAVMTQRPGKIKELIEVEGKLTKEGLTMNEVLKGEEFIELRDQVWHLVKEEIST